MENIKVVKVFERGGRFMSLCTLKRAHQLVARKKAKWTKHNTLYLVITKKEEQFIRMRVLHRDGLACYICGDELTEDKVTYDHIIPRAQNGTDFQDNLAVCCRPCNAHKGNKSYMEYALTLYQSILIHSYR